MKELCTTIFRIFGIYQLVRALESSGEIPLRVYFEPEKSAQTYFWIIQAMVLPLVLALLIFLFAGKLASFVAEESSEIDLPAAETMLSVSVFFLGIYLFTDSFPPLVSGLYNIYTNEFPAWRGVITQRAILNFLVLLISGVFICKPQMFNWIYRKVSFQNPRS